MSHKHVLPEVPTLAPSGKTWYRDELIDAMQKLAEDNPDRYVSRNFFRENTSFPDSAWVQHFGTFLEFQRAAGLRPTRYVQKITNQIASQASSDHLQELNKERFQYGAKYLRDRSTGRFRTMMSCSDLHDIEIDPFFERVWVATVKQVQPDVIVFNGDIFDAPEFGKYAVDPREWDPVGRIARGLETIRLTREAAPNAQIDFIEGNHEARILKHFVEAAPALRALLADLHGWDIAKLLKLDEYEINYVAQSDLGRFTDRELNVESNLKNYKVYYDCVMAHHHPEGRKHGVPGFHGHHHKHIVWSEYNYNHGSYEWHQLGCGHKKVASYTDGMKWNLGFIIANVDLQTTRPYFDYVSVGDTMAVAGGTFYYRKDEEFYPALKQSLRMA